MRTCRVVGSAVGLMRVIRPTNWRPGYPLTVKFTGTPIRIDASCSAGTDASSLMLDGSTTVNSAVPGWTTSPDETGRSLTTPLKGAVTVVLRYALSAVASLEFASSRAACAAIDARRD